jgi:transcription antitermination factor NusG
MCGSSLVPDMHSPTPEFPWFALVVRSRWEKTAASSLTSKGYDSLLPVFKERRRWSDRWKDLELPLFPGYVFCRFDPCHRLPVLTTPGVLSVVGIGKALCPVDTEEIAAIQLLARSGCSARPWPFLEIGQFVRVSQGPLCGLTGIVLQVKSETKLILSISLLRRSVAAEVDRSWITSQPPRGHDRVNSLDVTILDFQQRNREGIATNLVRAPLA